MATTLVDKLGTDNAPASTELKVELFENLAVLASKSEDKVLNQKIKEKLSTEIAKVDNPDVAKSLISAFIISAKQDLKSSSTTDDVVAK
jgi:hypothetical protein